ncbi:MAG: hypothetical protein JW894_05850 [Bacteroidales bacterium]|nr:hypothetical protein [Bacteroidales bacterium]
MEFEQPSIYINNLRIDEPVTVITDLVVSAVCFYAFIKLKRIDRHNKVSTFLKYYFLTMGIATTFGGIVGHSFLYALDDLFHVTLEVSPWKLPGWLISMFSITLVERAAIEYARPIISEKTGKIFSWINIIELIIFIAITFSTLNFFFVQVHAAYGLLVVVTSFSLYVYFKEKTTGSRTLLIAVVFAALSALVYMNKCGISPWFNHFDISHILMATSAWIFYRGGIYIISDPILINQKK